MIQAGEFIAPSRTPLTPAGSGTEPDGAAFQRAVLAVRQSPVLQSFPGVEPIPSPQPGPAPTPPNPAPGQLPEGQQAEVTVTFNAFIPQKSVSTPIVGTFDGDDRGVGEAGTHRTQQTIGIGTGPDGQPLVTTTPHVGETHRHGGLLGDATKTQSTGTLHESSREVLPDGTVKISLKGDSGNPLFPGAPAISYEMEVTAKRLPDGTWDVSVSGTHDAFPGYEAIAQTPGQAQEVLYGYDPRDTGAGPALGLAGYHRATVQERRDVVGDGISPPDPPPTPPPPTPMPTPVPTSVPTHR